MRATRAIVVTIAIAACAAVAFAAPSGEVGELEDVEIIFEVNETDDDAEVVLSSSVDGGFARVRVIDPRGKEIVDVHARDRGKIGLAHVDVESGEPDIASVKASFPEGVYRIRARTVDGETLEGEATLSHQLLAAPSFAPSNGEELPPNAVTVAWATVPGAAGYIVEIEQDDLDVNVTARLAGDATSFAVPVGFLEPGVEYEVGVATVSPNGNVAVAEGTFVTAAP